jgi:hypothetical protein
MLFANDFDTSLPTGKRRTCESCFAIDIRDLHREGLLRPGRPFFWSLEAGDEPLGSGARYRSPKTTPLFLDEFAELCGIM